MDERKATELAFQMAKQLGSSWKPRVRQNRTSGFTALAEHRNGLWSICAFTLWDEEEIHYGAEATSTARGRASGGGSSAQECFNNLMRDLESDIKELQALKNGTAEPAPRKESK